MRFHTSLFTFLFLALVAPVFAQSASHLKVQILSETSSLVPGEPVTLGVYFTIDRGWHIYWKNPGDAGLATSITWKLPKGFEAGKILWPIPQVIALPSVTTFGYEKEVLLMVPVTVPPHLKPGTSLNFSADVHWLVCNDICIPGEANLHLKIPVSSHPATLSPLFSAERLKLPVPLPKSWDPTGTLDSEQFQLTFKTRPAFGKIFFFPSVPDQIDNSAHQTVKESLSHFTLTLKRSDQLLASVQKISGLLVLDHQGHQTGYETVVKLSEVK